MATLEKIRSKSVLLFVIIIVALLAFILGDFLTSGRTYFGSGTAVAEAKGKKIDIALYNNQLERAKEQSNNYNNVDYDELAQDMVRMLIGQELLKQEYDDLGLSISDLEISEAMTGVMPHPAAQQFIYTISQNLGFDRIDGKAVLDAIKNPAKYNLPVEASKQLSAAWAQTEQDVEQAMLQQKFYDLVQGLFTANELDAKSVYNDNASPHRLCHQGLQHSACRRRESRRCRHQSRMAERQERLPHR
jgi:peptidyl-prolyl cis-trans isomerase D